MQRRLLATLGFLLQPVVGTTWPVTIVDASGAGSQCGWRELSTAAAVGDNSPGLFEEDVYAKHGGDDEITSSSSIPHTARYMYECSRRYFHAA